MLHPLSNSKKGDTVIVRCMECHCDDVCRLNELGCIEGVSGKIISNQKHVILQVGESRVAIAAALAKSILVSPHNN